LIPANTIKLRTALDVIARGGVVACPTEAVWGFSCNPLDEAAVWRLLKLKNRPLDKGLILVAADVQQLDWLLHDLPADQKKTLTDSWPGPATWLIPHRGRIPAWVHGAHPSVAVRVTAHPQMAALCRLWGGPLVSTSANPAGRQAPVQAFQVRRYFGDNLDYLLPGQVGGADRPSVIRDLVTGKVLRS
jgi:L-threonylcarbamoyladenylate synthase